MPVVSKGEFTVSRLDDGVSSHLHVGWLMADGTFTTEYPGENLIVLSQLVDGTYDQTTGLPTSGADLKRNTVPVILESGASYVVSNSKPTKSMRFFFYDVDGGYISNYNTSSAVHKITIPSNATKMNYVLWSGSSTEGSYVYWKLEKGDTPTIYTPAPSDDYTNAYPKYRGEYTDFTAADSTNPDDYTWTAYLGEQGPPTGVISQSTVPSSPYVGMLWQCTGNIAGYINPATYRWNGSAWEIYQFTAQNILAETFTGFTFQGVEFIGSKFVSEFDIPIGTEMGARAVGQTVIENGGMVTDMVEYLTDGDYDKHLEFSPNKGIFMTYKGRQTGDTQEAQLTPEGLRIKTPVAEAILSVATIYSLVRPARKNLTPANDVNRKGVVINYFRVGNLVNVAIKFELLKDTGWVALAPSPPSGYYPTSMYQASGVAGSVSYRGQTCMVYCNPDGLRLIPTTGQGTGEFQLSLTWTTNDPFPYGDS